MLYDQPVLYLQMRSCIRRKGAYLVLNANLFNDLEEGLTQSLTIVHIVKSREAEKATLDLPLCGHWLLNPMASYHKVAIGIASLPCVTCHINFTNDCWTLDKEWEHETKCQRHLLTLSRTFNIVRWFLNICVISDHVPFQPRIVTPFVARAARLIISLNLGCSSARIGYK